MNDERQVGVGHVSAPLSRAEQWFVRQYQPRRRRVLVLLGVGIFSALLSLGACVAVFIPFGILPSRNPIAIMSYTLPVIVPLIISPLMFNQGMRISWRAHRRAQELQREVERRIDAEKQLRALVETDHLTKLPNRRSFFEQANGYDRPTVVAVLDLDHFKQINDTYGHAEGDAVLRCFAGVLGEQLSAPSLVSRIGGEEFAAIVPDVSIEQARAKFDQLRELVALADQRLSVSIGFTEWQSNETIDRALIRADGAMYRAKERGRNRVEVATAA